MRHKATKIKKELIEWLEQQFAEHRVQKVIPDADTLQATYRHDLKIIALRELIKDEMQHIDKQIEAATLPEDLAEQIQRNFLETPNLAWDEVVMQLAEQEEDDNQ